MGLPPPLVWLTGFSQSLGGALGSRVDYEVRPSVNPLVYIVKFTFNEPISGKRMLLAWNLFQQYAAKNDSIPEGRVEKEGNSMTAKIIVKRRLGLPRND